MRMCQHLVYQHRIEVGNTRCGRIAECVSVGAVRYTTLGDIGSLRTVEDLVDFVEVGVEQGDDFLVGRKIEVQVIEPVFRVAISNENGHSHAGDEA